MPLFSDFWTAPWHILLTLLGVAPRTPQAASGVDAAASGSICTVRDVGDQVLSICRIGGYEMPSFIFWASIAIFALFLYGSFSLYTQCLKLADVLNRASRAVEDSSGPESIHKHMSAGPLRRPWKRYASTLLEPKGSKGKILGTRPPDDYLGPDQLVEHAVNTRFFSALPGVLTGVGLLMTFVAILDGLSMVSVTPEMDVKGIGGLINGLSGKFVSSIVAVACAVAFVFVERRSYGKARKAGSGFLQALDEKLEIRTVEQILHSLESKLGGRKN